MINRTVCHPAASGGSFELAEKSYFQAILPGSVVKIIKPVDNLPFSEIKNSNDQFYASAFFWTYIGRADQSLAWQLIYISRF
jgi:hypothetical protein